MAEFKLPYYKGHIDCTIPDELVAGVLVSKLKVTYLQCLNKN